MKTNKKIVMSMLALLLSSSVYNIVQAECYIMGDSIAQGLAMNRKDCSSDTQVGLNTKKAAQFWLNKGPLVKDKVIISLGVNDGNMNTEENLSKIRNNIKANEVIWILPPKKEKSVLVRNLASNYGDFVLNINSQLGKDNIHPTGKGYVTIAQHIKVFQYKNKINSSNDIGNNVGTDNMINDKYNMINSNSNTGSQKKENEKFNPMAKYKYTSDYIQN